MTFVSGWSTVSRWSTLDRVTSVEPGERAEGFRNIPNTLAIFDTHFPRFPVVPGILILGSMGALAAHLLELEGDERWRLAGADKVGFRHWAQPGDQMVVRVELKKRDDDGATLTAEALVDDNVITRVRKLRMAPVGAA
jgi:3-hydroxyacyl-[acyl-carrier-protein] dehydratase